MDVQVAFNIVVAVAGFLGGWILNNLRDSLKTLTQTDNELADKVQRIEILVAGQYVKRDDLDKMTEALFKKLDKIESKLDNKVDKQ